MIKTLQKIVAPLVFVFLVASPILALVIPFSSSVSARTAADCEVSFLGINPWYKGLVTVDGNDKCVVQGPEDNPNGLRTYITKIVLNIIGIILALTAYIAFFFILFGGFQFLTGGSNPSQIEKARKTILNAVIGLVISIGAVAVVNLVFGIIS